MADETTQLFLEDFTEGQIFSSPPRTITEADVLGFAALTGDAHPLHYDDEYAKTTRFGRPIVHGLHLMALTALGAAPLAERLEASMIAFLEQAGFVPQAGVQGRYAAARSSRSKAPSISRAWNGASLRSKSA